MKIPLASIMAAAGLAAAAAAQGPPCLDPTTQPEHVHNLWGGELRQVFSLDVGDSHHVWAVGDGGRILHADVGTSFDWEVQSTPFEGRFNLLDVHFRHVGEQTLGWACGLGGTLLTSDDLGATWNAAPTVTTSAISGCQLAGQPAALWRTRFLDQDLGFALGLWTFKRNTAFSSAGGSWQDVELYRDANLMELDPAQHFEFYALDLLGDSTGFIGVAAGQSWRPIGALNCPEDFEPDQAWPGVLYVTDSRLPQSDNGRRWWRVWTSTPSEGVFIEDPWDFEFEPQQTLDLDNWQGFLVGGVGTGSGGVFRVSSVNGSIGVTPEAGGSLNDIPTMYGVAALGGDKAIACGYAGQRLQRNTQNGTWAHSPDPTFTTPLSGAHRLRLPNEDEEVGCLASGSFGFLRYIDDYDFPMVWIDTNPQSSQQTKEHWRLNDVWFTTGTVGFAVGQFQAVIRTTDGGCHWDFVLGGLGSGAGSPSLQAIAFDAEGTKGVAVGVYDPANPSTSGIYFTAGDGTVWRSATIHGLSSGNYHLNAVTHSGGDAFWAVGRDFQNQKPLVLFSIPLHPSHQPGEHWYVIDDCLPSGVDLTGVTFLGYGQGLIVGESGGNAVAYEVYFSNNPPNCNGDPWHVKGVPVPLGTPKLNGIASRAAAGEALAVGDGGTVLTWTGTGFDGVTLPSGVATTMDLLSVDIQKDNGLVLIGTKTRYSELDAGGAGLLLRRSAGQWDVIKSLTNKSVRGIHLYEHPSLSIVPGFEYGWILYFPGVHDASSEFGGVADAGLLHFRQTAQ